MVARGEKGGGGGRGEDREWPGGGYWKQNAVEIVQSSSQG